VLFKLPCTAFQLEFCVSRKENLKKGTEQILNLRFIIFNILWAQEKDGKNSFWYGIVPLPSTFLITGPKKFLWNDYDSPFLFLNFITAEAKKMVLLGINFSSSTFFLCQPSSLSCRAYSVTDALEG